jgi:hypothetical protein
MKRTGTEWRIRGFLIIAATLAPSGCPKPEPPPIDARVWKMTRCIECIDGELPAVVAMGDTAVPALQYLLLYGPPDTVVAHKDSALRAPYHSGSSGAPLVVAPAAFVDRRIDDFRSSFRIRSSRALSLISSDSAKRALCRGRSMQFRDDVRLAIDSALILAGGTCP